MDICEICYNNYGNWVTKHLVRCDKINGDEDNFLHEIDNGKRQLDVEGNFPNRDSVANVHEAKLSIGKIKSGELDHFVGRLHKTLC